MAVGDTLPSTMDSGPNGGVGGSVIFIWLETAAPVVWDSISDWYGGLVVIIVFCCDSCVTCWV
jgi:hypothetical protein